ncbi:MAG: DUF4175 domain-containing protein, partial [Aestuariivirgaceae bacterium]|nr:DUF4175 domain-containing protein [Aestuariivirgaceae bacterium]
MPDPGSTLARKLLAARLVIALERALDAMFWPLMAMGLAAFFVLAGWVALLAPGARLVFWVLALILFAISLWPLRHFRFPDDMEATARLEKDSGLSFRPLAALRDRLASGEGALWQAHQARMRQALASVGLPRLRVSFGARDPFALRNALMLSLVAAVVLRGGDGGGLGASLPQFLASPQSLQVDGWVTPPAYTGKPPLLLAKGAVIAATEPIAVPAGSTLLLRMTGAADPELQFGPKDAQQPLMLQDGAASVEGRATITRSGVLTLSNGWRTLGEWELRVIPDQPPQAVLPQMADVNRAGTLSLPYEISDDYGVKELTLHFALSDEQEDGEGISGNGAFLAKPPRIPVALGAVQPRAAKGKASADLTKHAWAGLRVQAWVEARDGAGQRGASNRLVFKLPERKFSHRLSQALAEQRKFLLRDTGNVPRVVAALDAFSQWPQGVLDPSGQYLQLKAITRKLYRAVDFAGVEAVAEDLWNLAVALEGGSASDARQALEAARQALEEALAAGAAPEEVTRLVQELKAAMETYLAAMADAARRGQLAPPPSDGKPRQLVTPEELSKMLDQMQALSNQGDTAEALDLLAQLDQILKNLQMGQGQPGGNPDGSLMREFGKLMRGQQQLMDRTFRLPQGGEGEGPGEGADGLAREQAELGRGLGQLMDRLGERGMA